MDPRSPIYYFCYDTRKDTGNWHAVFILGCVCVQLDLIWQLGLPISCHLQIVCLWSTATIDDGATAHRHYGTTSERAADASADSVVIP